MRYRAPPMSGTVAQPLGEPRADTSTIRSAVLRRLPDVQRRLFCFSLGLSRSFGDPSPASAAAERLGEVLPFGRTLRQHIRHRPGFRRVPTASLLMGGQAGRDATAFAEAIGTLRYGSTPMEQSPHVALLRAASRSADGLSDEELAATEYWQFAHFVQSMSGEFFGAEDDGDLVGVCRNFISWASGDAPRYTTSSGSPFEDNILVARVWRSPLYQVIDGHHRVAAAIARGETELEVQQTWLRTVTPLQARLLHAAAPGEPRALRQPLSAGELGERWTVSRNCPHRLLRMIRFVEQNPAGDAGASSYLDVGADYGWFLHEMKLLGWQVLGIERDPLGVELGSSFFELSGDELREGDWTSEVQRLEEKFDVVSCFAFAGGGEEPTTTARRLGLLAALDRVTAGTLFVDAEDPEQLGVEVLANSSFTRFHDLGANADPVGPFAPSSASRLVAFSR